MMLLKVLVLILISLSPLTTSALGSGEPVQGSFEPVPSHAWKPSDDLPDGDTLHVTLIAKNVSGSITNTANQPVAHSAYRFVVNNVQPNTYVLVGAFGRYARMIDDRYIRNVQDRNRLPVAVSVQDLAPEIDTRADPGKLKALISDAKRALEELERRLEIEVHVITDDIAAPIDPEDTRALVDALAGESAVDVTPHGLEVKRYVTRLSFSPVEPTTASGSGATSETEIDASRNDKASSGTAWLEEAWSAVADLWIPLSIGLGFLILGAGGLTIYRLRDSRPMKPGLSNPDPSELKRTFRIREILRTDDGDEVMMDRTLPVFPGSPILVGADEDATLRLKAPGAPKKLCQLEVTERGHLRVSPAGSDALHVNKAETNAPRECAISPRERSIRRGAHEIRVSCKASSDSVNRLFESQ